MTDPASHAPPRPDRPLQGNANKTDREFPLSIKILIISIIVGGIALMVLPGAEEMRVHTFIQTTCLVEGYPEYEVIKDDRDNWRGFCINAIESVELPMHPDLNLSE